MTAESLLDEARRVIAEFPNQGDVDLLMEATREMIAINSGLLLEVPLPSRDMIFPVEAAAKLDIPHVLLVYLPGIRGGSRYPEMFRERLSSEGLSRLGHDSSGVQPGWRIIDARARKLNDRYEDDENFLEAIVGVARNDGEIPGSEELNFEAVPNQSRMGLIPLEIATVIVPKVEDLLGMPRGSMRLPKLREAMMTSSLYGFVPVDVREWQNAAVRSNRLPFNKLQPAGLTYTHSSGDGTTLYHDVSIQPKFIHDPKTGFRLQGMIS